MGYGNNTMSAIIMSRGRTLSCFISREPGLKYINYVNIQPIPLRLALAVLDGRNRMGAMFSSK
jgi:hypothetical protein